MVGTVTISVEVELGWGYHDLEGKDRYASLSAGRETETETLRRFLAVLDENDVAISFDVVGHLFLDDCAGVHQGAYPPGWFDADPGTNRPSDPLFYAPDLVTAIEEAAVDHEICTHTFSHVLCDKVSEEMLRDDLENATAVHEDRLGQSPRSLVTPRHESAPKSVLREMGIEVVRVPAHDLPSSRLGRLYRHLLGDHPVEDPEVVDGVTETYTSPGMSLTAYHLPRGQRDTHPVFRLLPKWVRTRIHRRYLERALQRVASEESHIHLWTHLHDMANDDQWPLVAEFVNSLGDAVADGDVEIKPMADLSR